jgi:hypothetical protein
MDPAYYILKVLHIYYNDTDYLNFELDRQLRLYYFAYDEDEEYYEDKVNEYKQNILTPKMNPIILYINNNFTKLLFETKYTTIIDNEINKNNMQWSDITKIIKVEERYEKE